MEVTLALEDGRIFKGRSFGAQGEASGEVVFNTSMMGYQEILTDPSYHGQMVTMTYPLIGNYGMNQADAQSSRGWPSAFIIKENSPLASNWRSQGNLNDWLTREGIIGMEGIDTRALTKWIRTQGAMKGVISTRDLNTDSLVRKARESVGLIGRDLVKDVTCQERYEWKSPACPFDFAQDRPERSRRDGKPRFRVVVLDYGVKWGILRELTQRGCHCIIVSAQTPPDEILALTPDGIVLSNGPGDPQGVGYAIRHVQKLLTEVPILGICLGHQILALAFGGKTYKLLFGHRGGNQPVKNLSTGRIEITAQNHGFAVEASSLPVNELEVTHINLNDRTVEGMRHKRLPISSVQYHPEACPGPHDSRYIFDEFCETMSKFS